MLRYSQEHSNVSDWVLLVPVRVLGRHSFNLGYVRVAVKVEVFVFVSSPIAGWFIRLTLP